MKSQPARTFLGALVGLPLLALAAGGALKSGPQAGEMVSAFEPVHVTGPDAGTRTCPVCKYGKIPAVQVWVNGDRSENVAKIADALEAAIKMEGPDQLKGFIVFIKPHSMAAKALVGIPVPFSSLIRQHLFVSLVRVTKTAFHRLILFEISAGQKRAVRAG